MLPTAIRYPILLLPLANLQSRVTRVPQITSSQFHSSKIEECHASWKDISFARTVHSVLSAISTFSTIASFSITIQSHQSSNSQNICIQMSLPSSLSFTTLPQAIYSVIPNLKMCCALQQMTRPTSGYFYLFIHSMQAPHRQSMQ